MKLSAFKYLFVYLLPLTVVIAFLQKGILGFTPVLFAFVLVPLVELCIKPSTKNIPDDSFNLYQNNKLYDWLIYLIVPVQWSLLIWFLVESSHEMSFVDRLGLITSMGLMCGVFGINVAHELGHRVNKGEQFLAKSLLLTSLYMQFIIEHNRGHHKNVGTLNDPVTARKGESVQFFWFRSIVGVYLNAWKIANADQRKKKRFVFGLANEMVQYTLIQLFLLALITLLFGKMALVSFLLASAIGYLLLETVEYIEHYGLRREKVSENRYENTQPKHSWNSNHQMGRLLLFELSRHSDHHFRVHKKYQTLAHHDASPQMPTGYPGMMLLSLIPPLWFKVMHKRLD